MVDDTRRREKISAPSLAESTTMDDRGGLTDDCKSAGVCLRGFESLPHHHELCLVVAALRGGREISLPPRNALSNDVIAFRAPAQALSRLAIAWE